jgi:hypothetical protein
MDITHKGKLISVDLNNLPTYELEAARAEMDAILARRQMEGLGSTARAIESFKSLYDIDISSLVKPLGNPNLYDKEHGVKPLNSISNNPKDPFDKYYSNPTRISSEDLGHPRNPLLNDLDSQPLSPLKPLEDYRFNSKDEPSLRRLTEYLDSLPKIPVALDPRNPLLENLDLGSLPPKEEPVEASVVRLPEGMKVKVLEDYIHRLANTGRYIEMGLIPEEYRLPNLFEFKSRLEALIPTFKYLEDLHLEANIIFVPLGLNLDQWNAMLGRHGVDILPSSDIRQLFDQVPKDGQQGAFLWDVAIIDSAQKSMMSTDRSAIVGGISNHYDHHLILNKESGDLIIALKDNPDLVQYLTLQLTMAEKGYNLVDLDGYTIVETNMPDTNRYKYLAMGVSNESTIYCHPLNVNTTVAPRFAISGSETLVDR